MKKNFLNIMPQEVIENGDRSLRYKGSDGKFHGIQSGNGGDVLSVEEVTRTVEISMASSSTNMTVSDFIMRYGAMKLTGYSITSLMYTTSSASKIYFDNGVQGPCPYRYNLSSTIVTFETNGGVIDQIDRETFNSANDSAKDFLERTIMSIIDELTPYRLFYFMLKSNFIVKRSVFTGTEMHLFSTAKDGTKTDLGVLYHQFE